MTLAPSRARAIAIASPMPCCSPSRTRSCREVEDPLPKTHPVLGGGQAGGYECRDKYALKSARRGRGPRSVPRSGRCRGSCDAGSANDPRSVEAAYPLSPFRRSDLADLSAEAGYARYFAEMPTQHLRELEKIVSSSGSTSMRSPCASSIGFHLKDRI